MNDIRHTTARDLMTTEVLPAKADWPLNRLAEFLVENDISGAPVIDGDGRLVGVVSLMDMVRYDALPESVRWTSALGDYFRGGRDKYRLDYPYADEELEVLHVDGDTTITVADIMNPTVFVVDPDTPASIMADMMVRGQIHRLVVTSGGKVEGLVSALDLLRLVRDE